MGFFTYNYRSQVLGHYVNISISLPTSGISYYDKDEANRKENPTLRRKTDLYVQGMKFQTLYLAPGADNGDLPFRYSNLQRYADEHKLMVVSPGLPHSFGVDAEYGQKYFTFLTEELPVVMQTLFNSSPKREDNFVAGYAMGGNVALGMAIIRPDLYCACVDLSGGIGMTLSTQTLMDELENDHFINFLPRYNAAFGKAENIPNSRFDLYSIAQKHKANGTILSDIYIACGSKEFIRYRVEEDVTLLKKLGYPVKYTLAEGFDHDFNMWDLYLKIALDEWLPLKNQIIYPE